jgi:hypothetical protein
MTAPIGRLAIAATAALALGLAGCVAYEPAPAYYAAGPSYYDPAPGPTVDFEFRGGDHEWRHRHDHWR